MQNNLTHKLFTALSTIILFLTCSATSAFAAVTYTYDANGNMTSDPANGAGGTCYEYNDANQLKKVKRCNDSQVIAEYVYDYQGNRLVKKNYTNGTLANTVNSWSDSFETKVINGGATETTNYYFANGEQVAKKNNDGSVNYVHNDHLGSTSVSTNQAGTLVETTSYDPWGKLKSGGTASKFGYTGQEHDSETGLDYYNARYYSTDIRRFTQPDTYTQNIYDPQDLNAYSYVRNNPLRYTDPTGHCSKQAGKGGLWGIVTSCMQTFSSAVGSLIQEGQALIANAQKLSQSKLPPQLLSKTQTGAKLGTQQPVGGSGNSAVTTLTGQATKTATSVSKVHGNDLRSTATTWGYTLRDKANGAIMKFGETINPTGRYSQKWLDANKLEFRPETLGSKADMRIWEHESIGNFMFQNGYFPELNSQAQNAVNVFR